MFARILKMRLTLLKIIELRDTLIYFAKSFEDILWLMKYGSCIVWQLYAILLSIIIIKHDEKDNNQLKPHPHRKIKKKQKIKNNLPNDQRRYYEALPTF